VVSWETRCWSQDLGRDESCPSVRPSPDKPCSILRALVAQLSLAWCSGTHSLCYLVKGGELSLTEALSGCTGGRVAQGLLIKLRFPLGTGSSLLKV
jgi:hypothetical protein